jgi:hypothetical protein
MADQVFMYGIVVGAFAVLTGILFSFRAEKVGREEICCSCYVWGRKERRNLENTFIIFLEMSI